ncbi:MAG TPA: hypothetical protein VF100_05480 [Thermoanaerobaculia bacterium]
MSGTEAETGGGEGEGAEAAGDGLSDLAYFRALEDFLIDLRGAPLLMSPADYRVAQRWHRRGIPLDHVREVMRDVYVRLRERGGTEPMNSLRYCARAVEAAWKRVEELRAPGEREVGEEGIAVAARLAALAAALPEGLPGRDELAARVTALAGDVEHVEAALSALDRELLATLDAGLGDEERAALEARVEETVASLFGRLFAGDVDRARDRLRRQLLRRDFALPVLSLFSPEAEAGEA